MSSGERRPKRRITRVKTKNRTMKTRRTNSQLATKAHDTTTSHRKLTLVNACWSSLDRRPRINSGSLSQSTFRYISVFLLQQINLTPKHYSPANFNWSWLFCYGDCLLRWQGCVPLVNGMTALITSLMCCHPGCHKVEELYRPNTWAFLPGFPYLRQINRVCKSVNEFLRNLA